MEAIEPGTAAWHDARCGAWTASRAPALMSFKTTVQYEVQGELYPNLTAAAKAAGLSVPKFKAAIEEGLDDPRVVSAVEPSAEFENLVGEIACERLTGIPAVHFVTKSMQRGIDLEPEAAEAYALDRMVELGPSKLMALSPPNRIAATPDRFVGDDGLLEIKCPDVDTKHLDTLRDGKRSIVNEYYWQCQFQLLVTERQWCDLASYSDRFPPHLRLAVRRIEADPEAHDKLFAAIEYGEQRVSELISQLEELTPAQAEAA